MHRQFRRSRYSSRSLLSCRLPGAPSSVSGLLRLLLAVILVLSLPVARAVAALSPEQQQLAAGNNEFAFDLYGQLKNADGNLFFSPYSISSAMAMTYGGAAGSTAAELRQFMHFRFDQKRMGEVMGAYNREQMAGISATGQKLAIANALVETGGGVDREYQKMLHRDYGAELFSGGLPEINGWVARKTEGKIPRILSQLDPNSVCVILNAIYFKGSWQHSFRKEFTCTEQFQVSRKQQVQVPFMHQSSRFRMLDEGSLQAISLPYKGEGLSMVILLPQQGDGLAQLERQLTSRDLDALLARLDARRPEKVDVALPKFTLRTGYDLVPSFERMGLKEPFGPKADFKGMGAGVGDIWIGQIKHKGVVEVNEEGTEAAAATAIEMVTKSVALSREFRADHPFMFLIRDNATGCILFMGRLSNPAR